MTIAVAVLGLIFAAAESGHSKPSVLKKAKSWDFFAEAKGQKYGDDTAGFDGSWNVENGRGIFEFTGGGSWGCGLALSREDAPANIQGAKRITLTLKASEGVRFYFYINEDGVGPTNATSYDGVSGADGEQYYHDLIAGDATEKEYSIEIKDLALARIWGNQNGDKKLALQAINEIGFYVPPDVREGRIEVVSVKFE